MNALPPPMALALCANFGSLDGWRQDFLSLADRGPAQLTFRGSTGTLLNRGDAAAIDGDAVLLALDCTSIVDVKAAIAAIDWPAVYERYQQAVHAASEDLGATHEAVPAALLLDVRRAGAFEQSEVVIPGARWCDPAHVTDWSTDLPRSREIVVYCVYGHEVGRATALRLRALGLNARYLQGGIDGWQVAGLPVARKGEAS